ncbi:piggyBac transposable element-derived protein 4-like [Aplysia californica]|uniref:PiggyBac transposable element-derived protein 4-like n=1 Tax=Aplysia californica TaxID=6500 RepID=A0ABM1W447_APLCA|nr:piggyBac transposable element-derived protein 4-like [Aplysia californica]
MAVATMVTVVFNSLGGARDISRATFPVWKDVTQDEMRAFLALIIATGLVKKDDLDKFWSTDSIICTPFFSTHMSLKRFENILSNLHLVDNNDDDKTDPLFKVRPFFVHLRQKFVDAYSAGQNLSFDEATCAVKGQGRLRFKVYNPKKPAKFGIKIYEVCESESGYLSSMNVYTGGEAEETFSSLAGVSEECCTTTKLVVGLLAYCGLLNKGHHVYLDNYYVSPDLFDELHLLGTGACGTVRTNRKEKPDAIKKKAGIKLSQGETIFRQRDNLLALRHMDKRDVHMLSTIHDANLVTLSKKVHAGNPIVKPEVMVQYVKNMGGVYLSDQLMKNYACIRRSVKWWRKFFMHLFCATLCNSYILYKKTVRNPVDHFQFRSQIVKSLLLAAPGNPGPSSSGRKLSEVPERLNRNFPHFPKYCEPKPGAKRQKPMRDCVVCNIPKSSRNGCKRTQPSFECKHCKVPLCIPECFEAFHTKLEYKPRN